jgi:putative MATE family efflux protein
MMMSGAALQAAGDPITPMRAGISSRVGHFLLSPLLIFGWGWFPAMGLEGAAMAGILAGIVGVIWNFQSLLRGVSRLHLKPSEYRLDLPLMWRMLRIGAPASITSMERSLSQLAVVWLVAFFGDISLAAYALAQRMQMLTNLGSMGLGMGAGVMVGQNLGAGKPERAREAVCWALLYVSVISVSLGVILWVFSEPFLTIFVRDLAVMEVAVPWLRIVVLGFMVMGMGMVFTQSYNTAGDTLMPMVVSLVTIWGVQVPLAIVLSGVGNDWTILGFSVTLPTIGNLGQYGIAWAIVTAMALRLFLYVPYFFTGRWLRKHVFDD